MITTYDLERLTPIVIDDPLWKGGRVLAPSDCAELRLDMVAPESGQQASSTQDFSAVIGQQVLAQLSE
jgi:hypothetical protein